MVLFNSLESSLPLLSSSSNSIDSRFSPWLTPIAYPLGCRIVIPLYFKTIEVIGREHLPTDGPVILAPTHRSRWDALIVPYAAGRLVTGRDMRFMVTSDEMHGIQGWFIRRLGGFPVNPRHPAIASLRFGVEILQHQEMMVIFPEGGIFRDHRVHPLKPGLARLAVQAEASQSGLGVKVVPMHLSYSDRKQGWWSNVRINIGAPLCAASYSQGSTKERAQRLTTDLHLALTALQPDHHISEPIAEHAAS